MTKTGLPKYLAGRMATTLFLSLVTALLVSADAAGQTVIGRARVGGYAEDLTYVASGKLKDQIVMINGFEVMAVQVDKKQKDKSKEKAKDELTSLFSLKVPELDVLPTGLAYIESEALFAFASDTNFKKLFLFDSAGSFKGTRNIQYLNSAYTPQHFEGMGYIPSSSPTFPDHLIVVVWDDLAGGPVRIEIMRRDGVVVSELSNPAWPAEFNQNLGDVAYLAPNRLLVTAYDAGIWTMDFSGNILSGPVMAGNGVGEGIVQMSDGRIVAAQFPQNLLVFDKNLARQPDSDRNDIIGLNLNTPVGVAWNPDTNQLLVGHDMQSSNTTPAISSVPTSLDSATQVADSSASPFGRHLAYLPGEHLIAMLHLNPRRIVLFNSDGTLNSQIDPRQTNSP
jgi:hypothetical protein